MSYNGWKNYETWNASLWLDNDEGSYAAMREAAQEAWDDLAGDYEDPEDRRAEAARALADQIHVYVSENMVPDLAPGMAADLLGAALSEIDYREIAEHYVFDVDTASDDDEAAEA